MTKLLLACVLAAGALLSGCAPVEYEVRPTHCAAYWVPPRYDRWGRPHRGHWRCR